MKGVTSMKNSISLINPISVNGTEITELTFDPNEITAEGFVTAEAKRKASAGAKGVNLAPAVEFDFGLHLYLGMAAVIAINPHIDFSDLERIKGKDIMQLMGVGRNFTLQLEGKSPESESEKLSETMQESTTQE
jgi:hypothetical protein